MENTLSILSGWDLHSKIADQFNFHDHQQLDVGY